MKFALLDNIIRSALQNHGYTLHWYEEAAKHASDCVREIAMDDVQMIQTVVLNTTPYMAITIPSDFIDWIRIGIPNGMYLKPLVRTRGFNRGYNYGTNGLPQLFPLAVQNNFDSVIFGIPFLSWYTNSYNSRGENTGGLYGYRADGSPMTFEVFPERNEIQLEQSLAVTQVTMDYISDGRSANAATQINVYAEQTIEDYIAWGFVKHRKDVPETSKAEKKRQYENSRRILRARLDDMDGDSLLNVFRKNYSATVKS